MSGVLPARVVRDGAWLGFFALILWAWWQMYAMATGMGLDLLGNVVQPLTAGSVHDAHAGHSLHAGDGGGLLVTGDMTSLSVLVPMWAIMMAAMMGPTFVPTARTYEELIVTGAGTRAGFLGLVTGYLGIWTLAAAGFGVAHAAFFDLGLLDRMGESVSRLFAIGLLLAAGAYQFTDAKARCLTYCRSPMVHFVTFWRPGAGGGLRMGARIGLWCVGCCWAIMALAFVGGAMNLVWMGIATLIMTMEKLPDLGQWLTRPLGVLFLGAAGLAAVGLI